MSGVVSGRREQVSTCPQICCSARNCTVITYSFGLRTYSQLLQFFEGGRAGVGGRRKGDSGGVSHLVGNGWSCEALGWGWQVVRGPWGVGSPGPWGLAQPDFIAQGVLKTCGGWEELVSLSWGLVLRIPSSWDRICQPTLVREPKVGVLPGMGGWGQGPYAALSVTWSHS